MNQLLLDGFGMFDRNSVGTDGEDGNEGSDDEDVSSYMRLVAEGARELYPGCTNFSKLKFIVRLLNIKNVRGVPISVIEDFLNLFSEVLPTGHCVPRNYHQAKQYVSVVGLGYDSYDACINDCIVFKGDNANAKTCPVLVLVDGKLKEL